MAASTHKLASCHAVCPPIPPTLYPPAPQGVLLGLEEDSPASRTIVLITDGKPTDPQPTAEAAAAAKGAGAKLVTVGAGDIDYATLKALASGPSYVFDNSNLDSAQLMLMADLASEGVCREED